MSVISREGCFALPNEMLFYLLPFTRWGRQETFCCVNDELLLLSGIKITQRLVLMSKCQDFSSLGSGKGWMKMRVLVCSLSSVNNRVIAWQRRGWKVIYSVFKIYSIITCHRFKCLSCVVWLWRMCIQLLPLLVKAAVYDVRYVEN